MTEKNDLGAMLDAAAAGDLCAALIALDRLADDDLELADLARRHAARAVAEVVADRLRPWPPAADQLQEISHRMRLGELNAAHLLAPLVRTGRDVARLLLVGWAALLQTNFMAGTGTDLPALARCIDAWARVGDLSGGVS